MGRFGTPRRSFLTGRSAHPRQHFVASGRSGTVDWYAFIRSSSVKRVRGVDFATGKPYAKTQTNGGTAHGADQGTRCTVWIVAGKNDHADLSNQRYVEGDGQPAKVRSRGRVQNFGYVDSDADAGRV